VNENSKETCLRVGFLFVVWLALTIGIQLAFPVFDAPIEGEYLIWWVKEIVFALGMLILAFILCYPIVTAFLFLMLFGWIGEHFFSEDMTTWQKRMGARKDYEDND